MTPATSAEAAEFPVKCVTEAKLDQFRRLLSDRLGCEHDELVFDEINDVYCRHCGKDFTD